MKYALIPLATREKQAWIEPQTWAVQLQLGPNLKAAPASRHACFPLLFLGGGRQYTVQAQIHCDFGVVVSPSTS
jgi:hypothetical protein